VDFPTRITNISATAIDNFFINKNRNETFSINSLSNGLSDHDAQLLILNNVKHQNLPNISLIRRDINEWTIAEFKLNLTYESWANVFNNDKDVNAMFSGFLNTYLIIFNHSFPHKKYFLNHKNKTWLTT
jgi:hypothetical protein